MWFQGGMEWGPRALGSNQFLRSKEPKNKRNIKFKDKRRESFRPSAPSILYEYMDQWFDIKKPN